MRQIRILVAEDNDSNYMLMRHILKGYDLVRAMNGAEAVENVRNGNFDFVLMDLKMPAMGGLEATRKIREFDSDIPIVALTANAFDSDRISAIIQEIWEKQSHPSFFRKKGGPSIINE